MALNKYIRSSEKSKTAILLKLNLLYFQISPLNSCDLPFNLYCVVDSGAVFLFLLNDNVLSVGIFSLLL